MRTVPVRAHTRQVPSLIENALHRRLKNEVALIRLDRTLSEHIESVMAQIAGEDRDRAERIGETW